MDYILIFTYVKDGIQRLEAVVSVKVTLTLLLYSHIISEVNTFCGIKLAAFLHFIIYAADTVMLIV